MVPVARNTYRRVKSLAYGESRPITSPYPTVVMVIEVMHRAVRRLLSGPTMVLKPIRFR